MQKMVGYDRINKALEDPLFLWLCSKGLASMKVLDYKVFYERYLHELKDKSKQAAIEYTAIEYNTSVSTVRRAVKLMTE